MVRRVDLLFVRIHRDVQNLIVSKGVADTIVRGELTRLLIIPLRTKMVFLVTF